MIYSTLALSGLFSLFVTVQSAAIPPAGAHRVKVPSQPKLFSDANSGQFEIQLYKPGVPYLHLVTVKLTKDQKLVANGDYTTVPFQASINLNNELISSVDNAEKQIVVSEDTSLRLDVAGKASTSANAQLKNTASSNSVVSSRLSTDAATDSPWSITADNFLKLNNESLAWSCPLSKSGVYEVFWTQNKPAGQYGCMRVDLFVGGPIANTIDNQGQGGDASGISAKSGNTDGPQMLN